jgi:hypothetical protein
LLLLSSDSTACTSFLTWHQYEKDESEEIYHRLCQLLFSLDK